MNWGTMYLRNRLLFALLIPVLLLPTARANDTGLSGSYALIHRSNSDGQTRVRLQVRLTNRGTTDLHVRRVTLWDLAHPWPGGTRACPLTIHAGNTASTTQDFLIPQAEYALWKHGTRPRLVVEVESTNGRPITQVIRLEAKSGRKEN